jgi:hypothetical protein
MAMMVEETRVEHPFESVRAAEYLTRLDPTDEVGDLRVAVSI